MQILVIDIHALSIVRCDFKILYMHAKTKLKQIYVKFNFHFIPAFRILKVKLI